MKYKESVKTSVLLFNVIDTDHQHICLITNKGHFSLSLGGLTGVLTKSNEKHSTNISN